MIVYYISPSTIPSRTANSIHVVNMCEALVQLKYRVVLFARSNDSIDDKNRELIGRFYGISFDNIGLSFYISKSERAAEYFISIRSVVRFFFDVIRGRCPKIIIARNLYAAFMFGVLFRREVVYETHSLENGFRESIQKWLLNSSKISTIVISNALKRVICDFYSVKGKRIYVFHDAARLGALRLNSIQIKNKRKEMLDRVINSEKCTKIIGYFGHLYPGRGIEVIHDIAKRNPEFCFVVYGGNEKEIALYNNNNSINNLFFMGHISPDLVRSAMGMMDVLLMPYQESVSIGIVGIDTSQWMSPMKMFEYMSVGVPIIASDLPVLREVLKDGHNSILVKPDDEIEWSNALQKVVNDHELSAKLGDSAYSEYMSKYNWKHRAKSILAVLSLDGD